MWISILALTFGLAALLWCAILHIVLGQALVEITRLKAADRARAMPTVTVGTSSGTYVPPGHYNTSHASFRH